MEGATQPDNGIHSTVKEQVDADENAVPENHPGDDQEDNDEKADQIDAEDTDDLLERIDEILDGAGEPYDTNTEHLPNVPAYRKEFRNVDRKAEDLFDQAVSIFENAEYKDEFTQRLLKSLEEVKILQFPEPKVLAFFGDSGVGMLVILQSNETLPAHLNQAKAPL